MKTDGHARVEMTVIMFLKRKNALRYGMISLIP